jgi:hypothetical protein
VSAVNLLGAFYEIHERKREVPFFYFVPDTTRDNLLCKELLELQPATILCISNETWLGYDMIHTGLYAYSRETL